MALNHNTVLIVSTAEAVAKLPNPAHLAHVEALHMGARFYQSIPRDQLFAWIAGFPALRSIYLADDWIANDQMAAIADDFGLTFPSVNFEWSFDGLAGGKHGR